MANNFFIPPNATFDRRRLGKYDVLGRLSTGGMSEIYLAHQSGLGGFRKVVVLKCILPDIGGEEDFVRMFLDEARITAAFNHPNIAQVFELDVGDGMLFMSMEFVQGCTLVEMARACRQAKQPIPVGFTLAAVRDTALALHYAHNFTDIRGRKQVVIHRDVAEKNIMVTYEGVTKLLDFGIAKAQGKSGRTSVGMVKGTSGYMSPEQIRGEPLDARSDIFSLGVVAHECLTGLRLFHGKTPEDAMMAVLKGVIHPPSKQNPQVPKEVDAVVMRALGRERDTRQATALELARALEKAAPGAIWHPEQSGELVSRFFIERREETRRMMESATFNSETTGEIRIESVIRKVRRTSQEINKQEVEAQLRAASQGPVAAAVPPPAATPPIGPPASLRRQTTPVPPPPNPLARTADEVRTNPARGAVDDKRTTDTVPMLDRVQDPPRPRAGPLNINLTPGDDWDDDESDAKTVPAAALPEELKALREKLRAKEEAREESKENTLPSRPAAMPAEPSVQVDMGGAPIVAGRLEVEMTPPHPAPAPMPRRDTGDTISITGNAAPRWDEEDDGPGVRTAIANPKDLANLMSAAQQRPSRAAHQAQAAPGVPSQSLEDARSTQDYPQGVPSYDDLSAVKKSSLPLIIIIVALVLAAAGAAAVLLDVVPLGSTPSPQLGADDASAAMAPVPIADPPADAPAQ